ncbi:ATP-binding protein [Candidatus Latescibacterota bacterium]
MERRPAPAPRPPHLAGTDPMSRALKDQHPKPRRRGILRRAALLSSVVAAFPLGLYALFMVPYQRGLLEERLRSTCEVVATSIAEVTVSSIVVENYSTVVDHCLRVVGERPAVLYIVVTRGDGFSLVHQADHWRYDTLDGVWLPPTGFPASGDFVDSDLAGQKVYHYSQPLEYSGIEWGWIHIGLSLEDFRSDVKAIYGRTAVLALLCFLSGLVASLVFARRLTDPLLALTRSADRVAQGDLSVRAAVHSGDEVESLAEAFNQMTEAVQKARGNLEATVDERTRELLSSEARWRSLVENAPDAVMTVDPDGIIRFLNRPTAAFEVGRSIADCVTDEHREQVLSGLQAVARGGEAQTVEVRRGIPDQPDTSVVLRIGPILSDQTCVGLSIIATDVSGRVETEDQMIRLERLSALGEMAAGVSHNLNNILTGIMGPAQLLQETSGNPDVLRYAHDIFTASERAADLVHRLHLTTRGVHDDQLAAVDLNGIVEEAVRTASPRWKDEPEARGIAVAVTLRLGGGIPPVRGTNSGMLDIVLNLLLNAVEALPDGGTVTITTSHTEARESEALLTVADDGNGMDDETRRRVFQPFFTTRRDVGSGLGLATCYGTVTRWGGTIEVESQPGEGSTFSVRLPAMGPEGGAQRGDAPTEAVRRARALIVDDEPTTRLLLSQILDPHHEVSAAGDGTEAMSNFEPGRYDVALIDLGMPGIPGDRLAAQMRQADPQLAVILVTGWELDDDDPRLSAFDFRLKKPFPDVDDVRRVVARAVWLHDERQGVAMRDGAHSAGNESPGGST